MSAFEFALFDTAIGRCGVIWSGAGIAGVQFPEADERAMMNRILRRFPGARVAAPPAEVQRAADDMAALLGGAPRDLGHVKLDEARLSDFQRRVYEIARAIPAGATLSYGEIADKLGDRTLAREVGQALGQNPFPIVVPCHRVLAADGRIGGFSAPGGTATKARLLSIERAPPPGAGPTLFEHLPWDVPRRPKSGRMASRR